MNAASAANAQTRAIPKGIVQRALEGVRYAITGVAPQNWFGPMQPLAPVAPAEVAGRRFDYPAGYNLQYSPRAYEPVGFADLRALADNCDILRLVIETRKDQIEAQDWDIRPKKAVDGTRPRAGAFASDIAQARNLLAFPDREHDFAQWTRQIAEEMFVTDATSIYKRRDRLGRVSAFEIIDGTTIAPRIDQWGRTPAPPDVAYQQILHGVPAADYAREGAAQMTADELIYYPRNKRPGHVYGHAPVEQVILTANIVTRRSLHQLAYYTDGNLTDAIFTAPSGWTTDQIQTWQNYWNALFAGNLRERRHGIWVPDGTKYTPLKDIVLKDAFDEYLARIVCFCFSISPQPFVSQVNRATAETAKAQATEEGLGPVLNWFKRLFDIILQRHLGYAGLEFVWIDDREMDPSAADAIDVADVKAGIRTINEVRMARGLESVEGCDTLMVATGSGYVPVVPQNVSAQAPAASSINSRVHKRTPRRLTKFNPNHRPAHSPDSEGGEFAPRNEGGSGSDAEEQDARIRLPADRDATEDVRVSGGHHLGQNFLTDSFGMPITPDVLPLEIGPMAEAGPREANPARGTSQSESSSIAVGTHGYVPQPGDEELLARAIFAEGSNTPQDMPAQAWSIVNRIGRQKYPNTLSDVVHQPGQFAFAPEGNRAHRSSDKWNQFQNPQTLKPGDLASRRRALEVAHDVLNGAIPDPTGGATHFFAREQYNGTPETAPSDWRYSLRDNRYSPSPYVGSHGNHFFILNPESEWLSNRRRRGRRH